MSHAHSNEIPPPGRPRVPATLTTRRRIDRPLDATHDGMEPPPPDPETPASALDGGGYVFVLELATLETAKVGKGYAILNCDDHANFIRRHGKQAGDYRPDICH